MVLVTAVSGFPSVGSKCGIFGAQICPRQFVWDGALDLGLFLFQKFCAQICTRPFVSSSSVLESDLYLLQRVHCFPSSDQVSHPYNTIDKIKFCIFLIFKFFDS